MYSEAAVPGLRLSFFVFPGLLPMFAGGSGI